MGKHNAVGKGGFWSRRSRTQKGIIIALSLVIVVAIIVVCVLSGKLLGLLSNLDRDKDFSGLDNSQLGIDVELSEEITNIALFGIDARDPKTENSNSDTIMILSLDRKDNEVKIVSIMRDSLVPIERQSGTKYTIINAAYSYGGPELAVKTINQVFGLNIKDYVTVNFYGLANIIDAVGDGKIMVNVLQSEIDDTEFGINEMITRQCQQLGLDPADYLVTKAGMQPLNGIQAVAYARIRKTATASGTSNDFGRVERQQYVMNQLLNKALELRTMSDITGLAEELFKYVRTSLDFNDLFGFAKFASSRPSLVQTRVPSYEYIINSDFREPGSSTVYYNYEYAAKIIHAFLYEDLLPEEYMEQNGVDKTLWYNH